VEGRIGCHMPDFSAVPRQQRMKDAKAWPSPVYTLVVVCPTRPGTVTPFIKQMLPSNRGLRLGGGSNGPMIGSGVASVSHGDDAGCSVSAFVCDARHDFGYL